MTNPIEEATERASSKGNKSIVNFTGPWCTVCHRQDDILKDFADDRPDISLHKFDVEEQPDLAEEYDVLALPTILVFSESGEQIWTSSGEIVEEDELKEILTEHGHG